MCKEIGRGDLKDLYQPSIPWYAKGEYKTHHLGWQGVAVGGNKKDKINEGRICIVESCSEKMNQKMAR